MAPARRRRSGARYPSGNLRREGPRRHQGTFGRSYSGRTGWRRTGCQFGASFVRHPHEVATGDGDRRWRPEMAVCKLLKLLVS